MERRDFLKGLAISIFTPWVVSDAKIAMAEPVEKSSKCFDCPGNSNCYGPFCAREREISGGVMFASFSSNLVITKQEVRLFVQDEDDL